MQGLNLSLVPETPFYFEKTFGSNSNAPTKNENRLHGVSPNPFNPSTTISCELAGESHLIITNASDDTVIHDESHHMLMAAWGIDYATVGVTNADGQIVLTDKRLFPFLYGIDSFDATDEMGETMGTIMLTASMRFYLADPGEGTLIRYNHDITGAANLNFTWNPSP